MKERILTRINFILALFVLGFLLTACGGDSSGGGSGSGGQGTLSTSLTDSSTDEYQAVYVTIARVDVHASGDGSWQTVATPNSTYNLLELVNGVREGLGISPLAAGHYTQMRLIIGEDPDDGLNIFSVRHPYANYIITQDNHSHELKVPSGTQTGLKVVKGFDINANETTELILDFDALRSVVKAGASGKYLLKPTIKVLDTEEYSIVSGHVVDDVTQQPIPSGNAFITAQVTDPANENITEQVEIKAGTLTNTDGDYSLFLDPGEYNLVATQTGYITECTAVNLLPDNANTVDFSLVAVTETLGSISGTVLVSNGAPDQHVTIDFRQEVTCAEAQAATMITIKTINIVNGGSYAVEVPAGEYQIVASTYDEDPLSFENVAVESGIATTQDINFSDE